MFSTVDIENHQTFSIVLLFDIFPLKIWNSFDVFGYCITIEYTEEQLYRYKLFLFSMYVWNFVWSARVSPLYLSHKMWRFSFFLTLKHHNNTKIIHPHSYIKTLWKKTKKNIFLHTTDLLIILFGSTKYKFLLPETHVIDKNNIMFNFNFKFN